MWGLARLAYDFLWSQTPVLPASPVSSMSLKSVPNPETRPQEVQLSRVPLIFTTIISSLLPAQEPIALRIPAAPTVPTTCLLLEPISSFIGLILCFGTYFKLIISFLILQAMP